MIKAVLPGMRARRTGTIVNISSIGARACPAGSGYYAATKAAMEAMTSLAAQGGPAARHHRVRRRARRLPHGLRRPLAYPVRRGDRGLRGDGGQAPEGERHRARNAAGRSGARCRRPRRGGASGKAPGLLVLGSDALAGFRPVMDGLRTEVDAWEHVSTSTDF